MNENSTSWLDKILSTGLGIGQAAAQSALGQKPATTTTPTATKAPVWLMPVAIGGGLLVLVLVFFGMRRSA